MLTAAAPLYHSSLESAFLPPGYIKNVNKQPCGRYNVTKYSKEEVRLDATLCPNIPKQLVMLQDLILIGSHESATAKEKNFVNLAAEIFMIMPNKEARDDFYQIMCAKPNILKIFAKAVKENVAIHSAKEAESKECYSIKELEN